MRPVMLLVMAAQRLDHKAEHPARIPWRRYNKTNCARNSVVLLPGWRPGGSGCVPVIPLVMVMADND
jgi:hypothetical protein